MPVYFIQANHTKLVKIGRVKDVSGLLTRMHTLKTMSPVDLVLLGVMEDTGTENHIHEQFAHLRDHGEWFRLDKEIIDYIEENATKPGSQWGIIPTKRCQHRYKDGRLCKSWASRAADFCHHHQP